MKYLKYLPIVLVVILLGCGDQKKVVLQGEIEGAQGEMIYLNKVLASGMQEVDSVKLKSKGQFKFQVEKGEYPDFYYLKFEKGSGLTLLVDSAKKIKVSTTKDHLAKNAIISGSDQSARLNNWLNAVGEERLKYRNFESEYKNMSLEERRASLDAYAEELKAFKDSLGAEVLKTPWSMVSYYILYQKLTDDYLVFDPYSKEDYKYFAAVATGLNMHYPKDPRVEAFYEMTLRSLKNQRTIEMSKKLEVAEVGIPDISLPNIKGDTISLSSLKGKVVVLNFWSSKVRNSRIWNRTLKNIYDSNKRKGLEIYQVSLDNSNVLWEKALLDDEIDWISVGDYKTGSNRERLIYNIQKLPTTFVIDKKGDIVGKFDDAEGLKKEVAKQLSK